MPTNHIKIIVTILCTKDRTVNKEKVEISKSFIINIFVQSCLTVMIDNISVVKIRIVDFKNNF